MMTSFKADFGDSFIYIKDTLLITFLTSSY